MSNNVSYAQGVVNYLNQKFTINENNNFAVKGIKYFGRLSLPAAAVAALVETVVFAALTTVTSPLCLFTATSGYVSSLGKHTKDSSKAIGNALAGIVGYSSKEAKIDAPAEQEAPAKQEAPVEQEVPAKQEAPVEQEVPAKQEAPIVVKQQNNISFKEKALKQASICRDKVASVIQNTDPALACCTTFAVVVGAVSISFLVNNLL